MTARVPLPSEAQVRQALTELAAQPGAGQPTVLALARSFGLANGTFWRHFPDIAREVADQRRTAARLGRTTSAQQQPGDNNPPSELARLRRTNRELTDQIEVAIAHLQRLTLENHTLREELEHSRKITHLPRAQPAAPSPVDLTKKARTSPALASTPSMRRVAGVQAGVWHGRDLQASAVRWPPASCLVTGHAVNGGHNRLWVRGHTDLRYACLRSVSAVGTRVATGYGIHVGGEPAASLVDKAGRSSPGARRERKPNCAPNPP